MKSLTQNSLIQELLRLDQRIPKFIMLIGPPGSGKSTFISELQKYFSFVVGSTDDQIDQYAKDNNITYDEAFKLINFKILQHKMNSDVENAVKQLKNIVIDQTNMSIKSRSSKIKMASETYQKIGITFKINDALLFQRLEKRKKETGKSVPNFIMESMFKNYQSPSKNEGFDDVFELIVK